MNVLDIECSGWDTFVTGALWQDGECLITRDPDELLDALLSVEGDVWAHNGGRYDWLWALDKLSQRKKSKARIYLSGSSATRIDIGSTRLKDSFRLIPMSLNKAAGIAGEGKTEVGLPCVCGEACGGYCSIRLDMPESSYRVVEEYLANDCRVLDKVLETVKEFSADNDIQLRGTVGGSAWATAQKWTGIENSSWFDRHYQLARMGYYGGRTEVARMHAPKIERYDIHSAYPAALSTTALPVGQPSLFARENAKSRFDKGDPGVWNVKMFVPEMMAPPLPVRTGERIVYPHGVISGVWARPEIERALEVGCYPVEWYWALVWDGTEPVLAETCSRIWELRARAERSGNKSLARWLKWLANSLTGKLAQDPETRAIAMAIDGPPKACPGGECNGRCTPGKCCDHQCTRKCGRWDSIDPRGRLWSRPAYRMPSCAYVQWAAYLTSVTRVELHKQIIHAGSDWVYTDTDSVYAARKLFRRLGDGLGWWGHEGSGIDWRAIAPKAYYYRDTSKEETPTWIERVKCKGLARLTPEAWEKYARGEQVTVDTGVEGLLTAARRGGSLFVRRQLSRASRRNTEWCGGRLTCGDGSTRPPTMADVEKRVNKAA